MEDTFIKLFSPPKNGVCYLSLDEARELAMNSGKYVLVNIQDTRNFESLVLNRDVWKAEVVQDLMADFFVFWQRNDDDEDALLFQKLYNVTKFPYIAAIDGRTGRQMKAWSFNKFSNAIGAQSELFEFIEDQQKQYRKQPTKEVEKILTADTHNSSLSEYCSINSELLELRNMRENRIKLKSNEFKTN